MWNRPLDGWVWALMLALGTGVLARLILFDA
jgi:hypothetical protein